MASSGWAESSGRVGGLFLAALHALPAGHALIVPRPTREEVLAERPCAAVYGAEHAARGCGGCRRRARAHGQPRQRPARMPAPCQRPETARHRRAVLALAEVVGQCHAKRALIVAAAGGHSVLMIGPPGSGKSMLAARLPELLPPLSAGEALEVASIASHRRHPARGAPLPRAPFRCPHHSASAQAIVGGGPQLRPGEISLAHRGVLFLDELPEFDRRVLESLREPLETRRHHHRARRGAAASCRRGSNWSPP